MNPIINMIRRLSGVEVFFILRITGLFIILSDFKVPLSMLDLELQDWKVKPLERYPFIAYLYSKSTCSVRSGFTIFAKLFKERLSLIPRL